MKEKWHGTPGGYTNHRCRCAACREANTLAMARYREKSDVWGKAARKARYHLARAAGCDVSEAIKMQDRPGAF